MDIRFRTVILVLVVLPSLCSAASFDCSKATTNVEKMICSDYTLRGLDNELAVRYEKLIESCLTGIDLKQSQRHWLKEVRGVCKTHECVKKAYRRRIDELDVLKRSNDTVCRICSLADGKSEERMGLYAKPAGKGCTLIVYKQGWQLVTDIELESSCPQKCKTFDPNQDGYDDFVIGVGNMMGPFVYTNAWIFSQESSKYIRDKFYPGGWPSGKKCTTVESRTGISGGEHVYSSGAHCYKNGQWVQGRNN